ncbi:MAG: archaemetzincin [Planctomycetota bacterium]|nr:archaemetzincin [Planctomycetota bacterium]
MKSVLFFAILLAGGVALSAWMGIADSRLAAGRGTSLNNSQKNPVLREGEVLIWDPNSSAPLPIPPSRTKPPPVPIRRPDAYAPIYEPAYASHPFYRNTRRLMSLAKPLGSPHSGDWRTLVREPEQDFDQFVRDSRRSGGTLVVQPIGDLPADQRRAIGHVLDAISAFFGVQAICASPISLSVLPSGCFRTTDGWKQINAEALMSGTLGPLVGGGVAAIVAVTDLDLYPGGDWPFESAFGWSSYDQGTAVVSTARIIDRSPANRGRNLFRLTKLFIHELSHTYALKHCSLFNCLMNGSGNLRESDAKPLSLCPDCLAKLSLVTGRDPGAHVAEMIGLCRAKGFSADARYYRLASRALKL